jgi:hypothetical protein
MTTLTPTDRHLVMLDGPDGQKWHVVDDLDVVDQENVPNHGRQTVTTACGRTTWHDAAEAVSPEGEAVDGLSGTTICYNCGDAEIER